MVLNGNLTIANRFLRKHKFSWPLQREIKLTVVRMSDRQYQQEISEEEQLIETFDKNIRTRIAFELYYPKLSTLPLLNRMAGNTIKRMCNLIRKSVCLDG